MYDDILLPVDGSEAGEAAVGHARDLAATCGATVNVLHVVEVPASEGTGLGESLPSVLKDLHEAGEDLVARIADELGAADVPARTAVRDGVTEETIRAYADEVDADVIVMGTHGRTGLQRYLVGSTTERIVRTAGRPVLTVGASDGIEE